MIGSTESVISSQVLADVPATPTNAPVSDASVTTVSVIKATWDPITDNGGSEILSYSLEIDDGTGGDFTPVIGFTSHYLLNEYTVIGSRIRKATLYRLRYRSLNAIGWSDYSPIAYIRAANVPDAPTQLRFVSSTQTTVTLELPRSLNDGGSPILSYKLWVDAGNDFSSSFTEVQSYNG